MLQIAVTRSDRLGSYSRNSFSNALKLIFNSAFLVNFFRSSLPKILESWMSRPTSHTWLNFPPWTDRRSWLQNIVHGCRRFQPIRSDSEHLAPASSFLFLFNF